MNSTSSPWLTVPEAANYARCGTKRIYDACRTGELVATQQTVPHGTWRIHVEDLDNYLRGATTRSSNRRRASAMKKAAS
ncbi:helix-turn-helix domain-containing protein [Rhodococcus sp. HS-D2]|uniref:helix-turn-helix domain-containing protein n=1 Tax=Rhodococcus sp. HS-D2 TaxID=1384636 RepID=UPI0009EEF771|nr:helix-turn-helix domain-containing protein [Rhodococcus sp. HS-D2]